MFIYYVPTTCFNPHCATTAIAIERQIFLRVSAARRVFFFSPNPSPHPVRCLSIGSMFHVYTCYNGGFVIVQAVEDVNIDQSPRLKKALKILDKMFTVIFVFEMIVKMTAYGFRKYFTDAWCWLDFVIVLVSEMGSHWGHNGRWGREELNREHSMGSREIKWGTQHGVERN